MTPAQQAHAVWFAVTVSIAVVASSYVAEANAARDEALRGQRLSSEDALQRYRQLVAAGEHIKKLRSKCGLEY